LLGDAKNPAFFLTSWQTLKMVCFGVCGLAVMLGSERLGKVKRTPLNALVYTVVWFVCVGGTKRDKSSRSEKNLCRVEGGFCLATNLLCCWIEKSNAKTTTQLHSFHSINRANAERAPILHATFHRGGGARKEERVCVACGEAMPCLGGAHRCETALLSMIKSSELASPGI
jgi:hypothetical protein